MLWTSRLTDFILIELSLVPILLNHFSVVAMIRRKAIFVASVSSNRKVGMMDLMKALKDPGVNRAIGIMMAFAQEMGEKL